MIDALGPVWLADPVVRYHPLNRGRVAWWLALPGLDGGRQWYDIMGLVPGTLTNMTGTGGWRGTARPGGWGQMLFDGTDDYVALPQSAAYTFGAGDFALACWFRPATVTGYQIMIGKDVDTGRSWVLGHGIITNGRAGFSNFSTNVEGSTALAASTWYRLVCTRASGVVRLYLNGGQDASASLATDFSAANAINLGRREYPGFPQYYGGAMDDVSVWSRALSAADAKADYDLSRRGYPGVLRRIRPPPPAAPAAAVWYPPARRPPATAPAEAPPDRESRSSAGALLPGDTRVGNITLVQETQAGFADSTLGRALAFPANVRAGDLLVVGVTTSAAVTAAVTDTLGNVYQRAGVYAAGGTHRASIWFCLSASSGANTVTATPSATTRMGLAVLEYAGVAATQPLDGTANSGDGVGTTALTTTTVPVYGRGELVLGLFGQGAGTYTLTATGGFTLECSQPDGTTDEAAYALDRFGASAAVAATGTLSSMAAYAAAGASFKPALAPEWFPFKGAGWAGQDVDEITAEAEARLRRRISPAILVGGWLPFPFKGAGWAAGQDVDDLVTEGEARLRRRISPATLVGGWLPFLKGVGPPGGFEWEPPPASPAAAGSRRVSPATLVGFTGVIDTTASFTKSRWKREMPAPPIVPPSQGLDERARRPFPSGLLSGFVRGHTPPLVGIDPEAAVRSRRHQQQVASILNALMRGGDLAQSGADGWFLGHVPSSPTDWNGVPPTGLSEAIDRLVRVLSLLGYKP